MTIQNKPTIHNTPTVYNTGAGGGDCVEIAGKYYKTKKINNKLWLAQNLEYIDSNILYTGYAENTSRRCNIKDFELETITDFGYYYNIYSIIYMTLNQSSLFGGWRLATKNDYEELINEYTYNELLSIKNGGLDKVGLNFALNGRLDGIGWGENNFCYEWCAADNDTNYFCFELDSTTSTSLVGANYWKYNFRCTRLVKDL